MAGREPPRVEISHTTETGWKWVGYNGVDSLAEWGHGFITRSMAEEAGARWLKRQQAATKPKRNGKGKRGNARK